MSAAPALLAQGVSKRYGDWEALRDVSLTAAPGELLAIIGPNGAGKTTLLSILAGVLAPSGGTVSAAGRVGWVPQQNAVYSKLSVIENLRLFARLEGLADQRQAVATMLDQTGLAERADEELGRLSGGNRQRVNIAVGLLGDPSVLLLDEPSAALDPRQRDRLWEFIVAHARRGTSVIYATHDIAEAQRYADRVLVLADGQALFDGPAEELRERGGGGTDLERAFVAFLETSGH